MNAVDGVREPILTLLRDRYEDVRVDTAGAVTVPRGRTSVGVSVCEVDDQLVVAVRAAVLRNVQRSTELLEHVALEATRLRLGSLSLVPDGEGFDLDVECRTLARWTSPEEAADLVAVLASVALEQALHLQPRFGGTMVNDGADGGRVYAEQAMTENAVVADALTAALEGRPTTISGAAEGAWVTPGEAVLGRVVFAMTGTDLWLAGWPRYAQQPAVWRVPHVEITEDHVRHDQGATDYVARFTEGRWLGVRMIEADAAEAMCRTLAAASGGRPAPRAEAGARQLPADVAEQLLGKAGFPTTPDNVVAVQERLAMMFTLMARGYMEQVGTEEEWSTFCVRAARPRGDLHAWPQTVLNALCRWDARIVPHTQDMPERATAILLEAAPGSFFGGPVDRPLPRAEQFGTVPTRLR